MLGWYFPTNRALLQEEIRINEKAILHIVFSDSRSHENLVFISTKESLENHNVMRLEDAYSSEDLNLELIIRSDKGVYCKAQIHIPPYKDFLSIKMEIISQESNNMIWQTVKAKLNSLSTRWKKRSGGGS
jgi:hypothetical protein